MNVGFVERQLLSEVNGCKLFALVEANHYMCWNAHKGAHFNQIDRYHVKEYVMSGPTGIHTLSGDKSITPYKRLVAHWNEFAKTTSKIKRVLFLPKRWYE